MELEIYIALKAEIETALIGIEHVGLWNNQFDHSNIQQDEEAFLYPCVFIEFSQPEYRALSQGVQQFDLTITTHLGFESLKTEDLQILTIKQELYKVIQRFRNGYFDKLNRVGERQDWNHNNIQIYETDFFTTGKDYSQDIRPNTLVSPSLIISATPISLSGITI